MFYKLKKGKQKEIFEQAIKKIGSEKKLSQISNIPAGSIYHLKYEKRNLSEKNLNKIIKIAGIKKEEINTMIDKILPNNWGQKKGGALLIKKKKEEGKLDETIKKLKLASSKRMKKWHKEMKEKNPEKYYKWQYERFKKIGKGYPFKLTNGIKVRNILEKNVGNFLLGFITEIEYEPYINISGKAYFPDFKYKNKILEVTEWKHPSKEKINYLKKKIFDYKQEEYEICFFIPNIYRKFYKELDSFIISDLTELKGFFMPP